MLVESSYNQAPPDQRYCYPGANEPTKCQYAGMKPGINYRLAYD